MAYKPSPEHRLGCRRAYGTALFPTDAYSRCHLPDRWLAPVAPQGPRTPPCTEKDDYRVENKVRRSPGRVSNIRFRCVDPVRWLSKLRAHQLLETSHKLR